MEERNRDSNGLLVVMVALLIPLLLCLGCLASFVYWLKSEVARRKAMRPPIIQNAVPKTQTGNDPADQTSHSK
jgi:hypothetical protein